MPKPIEPTFESLAIACGLLITTLLGFLCKTFLDRSIDIEPPVVRGDSGAGQLGLIERLLFFVTFYAASYPLAAGWLAFKVATKWYGWQHVARIPADDYKLMLKQRVDWANYLVGRSLNGTLYNGLAGAPGMVVAEIVIEHRKLIIGLVHGHMLSASLIVNLAVIVLVISGLFAKPKPKKG
ncbi:MAG: hypothetical protein ACM3SP_04120 [Chloroflexota bacterium]